MQGLKSSVGVTYPFSCLSFVSVTYPWEMMLGWLMTFPSTDVEYSWIPLQIMDFNNVLISFILFSFCTLWLKLLLSCWTFVNESFLILTVHSSICGASNRNDRFDRRLDLWRNSIPGLPHVRHEDLVPKHRGSCCAAVGAPWAVAQWQGSAALWATHPQQNIPFAFHSNLGEQPLFLHEG